MESHSVAKAGMQWYSL
ncbi:hypothetical protein AAY473_002043 [Plecturocebus cupreus]